MFWAQARHRSRQIAEQVLYLFVGKSVVFSIPFFSITQAFAILFIEFGFIAKLVVEELIEKHFSNDAIFATRSCQSKGIGCTLQRINQCNGGI